MTNASEEFKSTTVHPFARFIVQRFYVLIPVYVGTMLALAYTGGTNISITFGAPTGRTAYSPTNAEETERMDRYINAQRTVTVKSASSEQQTIISDHAYVFSFEELNYDDRSPNLDAQIFTERNLELILRAQKLVTDHPDYSMFCVRCALEDSLSCERTKALVKATDALIDGIDANATVSEAASLADKMTAKAQALCDLIDDTCPIKNAASDVEDLIADGTYASDADAVRSEVTSKVKAGADATKAGVCAAMPGCEKANTKNPICAPPYSPLSYFYDYDADEFKGTVASGFKKLDKEIDVPDAEDIPDRVALAPANFYLPSYYEEGDLRAHKTRLSIPTGLPLEGYLDANDRAEEQEDKIVAFLQSLIPAVEALRQEMAEARELEFRWIAGNDVLNSFFQSVLSRDVAFVLGAVIFVLLYIRFHTGSIFLAWTAVWAIIICFPAGAFWTIIVCQVKFFDPLNMFLLFVLLGLGADGIFIVFDQWEQSREGMKYWAELHGEDQAMTYRMSYVWRRSARAMFAANITTALSFIAVIPSPVMPMAAFGILSSFTIIHNWIADVTIIPALILVWDSKLRTNWICCCKPRAQDLDVCCVKGVRKAQALEGEDPDAVRAATEGAPGAAPPAVVPSASRASASGAGRPREDVPEGEHASLNRTERFFRDTWAPFVVKYRLALVAFMACFFAVFVYFTTQLEPSREAPQILPDSNPVWEAVVDTRDGWMEGETEPRGELWMVWGVKGNDYMGRSKFEFQSPECNDGPCGEAVFDSSFDPSPPKMQKYLLEVCRKAARIEATTGEPGSEFIFDEEIAACLMKDFRSWLTSEGEDFPVEDEDEFWEKMHEYLAEPEEDEPGGEGYSAYVQKELVRLGRKGKSDEQRMYFMISAVTMDFNPALFYGIPEIQPGRDAAYAFEEEYAGKQPEGQPHFFVTTSSGVFTSMRMQQAYISSTVSGVLTALGFALASLLVFVGNVIVSLLAFVCIGGVVCCTLGLMVGHARVDTGSHRGHLRHHCGRLLRRLCGALRHCVCERTAAHSRGQGHARNDRGGHLRHGGSHYHHGRIGLPAPHHCPVLLQVWYLHALHRGLLDLHRQRSFHGPPGRSRPHGRYRKPLCVRCKGRARHGIDKSKVSSGRGQGGRLCDFKARQ